MHEGFVNPCIVDGEDIGKTLYTMGFSAWFVFATFPIAFFAFAIWIIVEIVLFVRRRRNKNS